MAMGEFEHHDSLQSPFSRVYLCPETEQIINCAMGLKYPIDVKALKIAFSNSIMIKHPRFCSLLVRDHNGEEHWKTTHVNIDDHIILHHSPTSNNCGLEDDEEATINAYLADIAVSTPLSKNKPLWEVHVLVGVKCVVLRVHHALGDGVSLMSMLSACFGKKRSGFEEKSSVIFDHDAKTHATRRKNWKQKGLWALVKSIWFSFVFGLRLLGRGLWVKDEINVVSGGDGVELWPRKLATAKFKLEDFKLIKKAIPNATVNDVLLGVISSGLSKYLEIKAPKAMLQGLQVTGIVVVNLRKNSGLQEMSAMMGIGSGSPLWGNKTGLVLQPLYCCNGLHPLEHVRAMKAIMDKKKLSYEAHLSNWGLKVMSSSLGPKRASWFCHRVLCNTTLLISNIIGPTEELTIGGNPITYLRVNISSQPHAMTIHMVSYAGNADLQMMVAENIIPDPEFLVKCFKDSLTEMKNHIYQNNKMILGSSY